MEPTHTFDSSALRANLETTRPQTTVLPAAHQALLDAAARYHGVHKRLHDYLNEYHHRYPDREWIVTQLRSIALQDFWYYRRHERAPELLSTLVGICAELLTAEAPLSQHRRVFQTLLEFIEHCVAADQPEAIGAVIARARETLEEATARHPMLAVVSSALLRSVTGGVLGYDGNRQHFTELLRRALTANLRYWQDERYVEKILAGHNDLLGSGRDGLLLALGEAAFQSMQKQLDSATTWEDLMQVPDFNTVADGFRRAADLFSSPLQQAYYLSAILPLPGLAHLKEYLFWDLNRVLRGVRQHSSSAEMSAFLVDLFRILETLRGEHMSTVLDCLRTLGEVIFAADDQPLIDGFTQALIDFGFVRPGTGETGGDWRSPAGPDHVKNIRVWLDLIKANPQRSARLLSSLILHLKLGGVFIQDNDLFQRDVTSLLNADIRPLLFLVKQLALLFPVYFNEIGAEGELRDESTVIDEVAGRHDPLIHFLRKQIHAESNNTHLQLATDILRYWAGGDAAALRPCVPPEVHAGLTAGSAWWEKTHEATVRLAEDLHCTPPELPRMAWGLLKETAAKRFAPDDIHAQRVLHLCRIHQLLEQKYSIAVDDILPHMEKLHTMRKSDIEEFRTLLEGGDSSSLLDFVFRTLRRLHEVILDPVRSEGREEIYYKRHIAAGIPSMYGRYLEPKFQALGLVYRFEALAAQLLSRIIEETNLHYITAATLRRIHCILTLFRRALEIEGYSDEGFNSSVEMLRFSLSTTSFTIHQYINLFQFLEDNVKSIIYHNFITPHEGQLQRIVPQYLPAGLTDAERVQETHAWSERVYRDLISGTFPIQQLDNFIAAVLASMNDMLKHLRSDVIQSVMGYDPRLVTTRLFQSNPELDNPVFLGAKGYYLKRLYQLGYPVPPGFILTTELFRRRDAIIRHPDMRQEVVDLLRMRLGQLEALAGESYGDPSRPLLLSVRSGAAISIPGAMNTFLNVGMNEGIVEGMSRSEHRGWTAWDCYRRFMQTWGMVNGIPRDAFDAVMIAFKERCGVTLKIQFLPEQMRDIARAYRRVLEHNGVRVEEDPFEQLVQAVLLVLDSWYTERARVYRRKLQIAEDWGTAVVVQRMVLGNRDSRSGSGVLFTHDPFVREAGISLYGDFTVCSQGEDIVAGLVHTLPISERQRLRSQTPVEASLEIMFPELYRTLGEYAAAVVLEHSFGHQEMEFTFESEKPEDLHILQTRDHAPQREARIPVFEFGAVRIDEVGSGIGIGGGAMNGSVCFDLADLQRFRRERPGEHLILIRPDTVPDDIGMIFECDGLLTARGGATSHAAVTAVRLRKTCVVDCRALRVDEEKKSCVINDTLFRSGDAIAIDGRMGSIYRGQFPISFIHVQMP